MAFFKSSLICIISCGNGASKTGESNLTLSNFSVNSNNALSPSSLTLLTIGPTNDIISALLLIGRSKYLETSSPSLLSTLGITIRSEDAFGSSLTGAGAGVAVDAAFSSFFCSKNFGLASPLRLVTFNDFNSKFLSISLIETPYLAHLANAKYNKSAASQAISSFVVASVNSSASSLILAFNNSSSSNNLFVYEPCGALINLSFNTFSNDFKPSKLPKHEVVFK
ncbi:unnamed protein product [[Candida] boidinii]|nr:unnamed protein product [[Candida] boidinii]